MATYAVGDIQGCWDTLNELLDYVKFDEKRDAVIALGDLVNRGPKSLEVLRWAKSHDYVRTVLGNHDLHLVGRYLGLRGKSTDTFDDVLAADDVDELIEWMCAQPFLIEEGDYAMVHAGLNPTWDWETCRALAAELTEALSPENRRTFLEASYQKPPPQWDDALEPPARWAALFHTFTRMRVCKKRGKMDLEYKGGLKGAPSGYAPWYEYKSPRGKKPTVLFGHWSALGFYDAGTAVCLDSGCVWGGDLTALRLDDDRVFHVGSVE